MYSLYYASANHGDGYESRIALYSTEGGVGSINVIEEITSTPFPEKVWISKVGYWIKTTNVPVQLNYEPFFEPGQVKRETIYRVVSAFGELPTLNSAQYRKERDGTWTQLKDFNNGYPTGTVWFTDCEIIDGISNELTVLESLNVRGATLSSNSDVVISDSLSENGNSRLLVKRSDFVQDAVPSDKYMIFTSESTKFVCFARLIASGFYYVFEATSPTTVDLTDEELLNMEIFSAGHILSENVTVAELKERTLDNLKIPVHTSDNLSAELWIPSGQPETRVRPIFVDKERPPYIITNLPLLEPLIGDGRAIIQVDISDITDLDKIKTQISLVMDNNLIKMSSDKLSDRKIEFSRTKSQTLRIVDNSYIGGQTRFTGNNPSIEILRNRTFDS